MKSFHPFPYDDFQKKAIEAMASEVTEECYQKKSSFTSKIKEWFS